MSQNSLTIPNTGTLSGLQLVNDINNALDTLNTLASGASAPGSPEAGQLWHDTTANQIKLRNQANNAWIVIGTVDETNNLFSASAQPVAFPQGRLTLTSNTPIMTADATAQTAIYYTPYNGNSVPVYNGTNFINTIFSQLTLTLNSSNHLSGNLYDIFVFLNSGVLTIAASPAWTNSTTRSAALTQLNGIWVNNASINLTNGATTYSSVGANKATYLGTFYATANGQTGMACKPAATLNGTNNILGLWNAYNRESVTALCRDTATSWTTTNLSLEKMNASTSWRISWVDGLAQSFVHGEVDLNGSISSSTDLLTFGVLLNATSGTSNRSGFNANTSNYESTHIEEDFYPVQGFNYLQAMQGVIVGGTGTIIGSTAMTVALKM